MEPDLDAATLSARTGNLLGALAVALADEIHDDAKARTEIGGEAPAALVFIGHAPGCSIDFLARLLRLSHPGTVRLVDRLVVAGLVERRAASDGRAVALHLTDVGARRRRKLLAGRQTALDKAVTVLSPTQREQLATIAEVLLKSLRGTDTRRAFTICRLCDERDCANCPLDD